jgi:hypothetical protein
MSVLFFWFVHQKTKSSQASISSNQPAHEEETTSLHHVQAVSAHVKVEDADIFENSLSHSMADAKTRDTSRSDKRSGSNGVQAAAAPVLEPHNRNDAVFKPIAPPIPVMMQSQGQHMIPTTCLHYCLFFNMLVVTCMYMQLLHLLFPRMSQFHQQRHLRRN